MNLHRVIRDGNLEHDALDPQLLRHHHDEWSPSLELRLGAKRENLGTKRLLEWMLTYELLTPQRRENVPLRDSGTGDARAN